MVAIDTLLFDLDDTICQYERSTATVLGIAFDSVGVEPFFESREYVERFTEFADAGEDVRDIRRAAFETFAAESGVDEALGRAVADAYADERDQSRVEFMPGARAALDALDGRYTLGMVTDGDPWMQSQKLDALGIADRFETVVHGGHDAPTKPDPDPFAVALAELGSTPERTAHIGNSIASDVRGAHNAGLHSVWVPPESSPGRPAVEPDYRLDSLHHLADEPWE